MSSTHYPSTCSITNLHYSTTNITQQIHAFKHKTKTHAAGIDRCPTGMCACMVSHLISLVNGNAYTYSICMCVLHDAHTLHIYVCVPSSTASTKHTQSNALCTHMDTETDTCVFSLFFNMYMYFYLFIYNP